ncbi:MAG: hypothetical protein IID37_07605 [Planctomycetes bacterium]|nr:hypothetical protein [Planctomycetota bacterium]
MTRQDHVLRTTTLERMVFSLTLTALLLGTNPGAAADTLDSPDMFPDGDTTEKFVTLGTLTATDESAPPDGISDAAFTVPGTVNWTFTWKVNVASWDIADPADPDDGGANDGAVDFEVFLEGEHITPPPAHNHTPPENDLPQISSKRGKLFFNKQATFARNKAVNHGDHVDKYWFRYRPTASVTNNTPALAGLAKVRAQHSKTGKKLFGSTALKIGSGDSVGLSYDADSLVLSLSLGPIDGLDNEGGQSGGIDPEYVDDPILAGEVSVTALEFLGQDDDGRYLFGGGEIEIIDPAEQFVFRASFSEYVLDPTALPEEPTGLAWVESLGISDIPDDQDAPSQFLRDYVERAMFGEDMPTERSKRLLGTILSVETILDLVVLTEGFTQSAFDIPATVQIGAAFSPPCQCQGDVNQDGIVDDVDVELVLGCQGAEPEEECEAADINCDDVIDEQDIEAVLCLVEGDDALDCCAAESESAWEDDANGDDNVDPLDSGFGPARFGDWP